MPHHYVMRSLRAGARGGVKAEHVRYLICAPCARGCEELTGAQIAPVEGASLRARVRAPSASGEFPVSWSIPARAGVSLGDNVRVKHNDIVSDMLRQARESHPEFSKMEMLRFEVEFRAKCGGRSYYILKSETLAKREQTKPTR